MPHERNFNLTTEVHLEARDERDLDQLQEEAREHLVNEIGGQEFEGDGGTYEYQDRGTFEFCEVWEEAQEEEAPNEPYDWTKDPHHLQNPAPANGREMVSYGPWMGWPGSAGMYPSRIVLCRISGPTIYEGGEASEWAIWEQSYTGHCETGQYFRETPGSREGWAEDEARLEFVARIERQAKRYAGAYQSTR